MATGFHPVIHFPEPPVLLDLSGPSPDPSGAPCSIGRYNEVRGIYTQALFEGERNIHMGIDLGAKAGTPVYAFSDCTLFAMGINKANGDYGPTLVLQQELDGRPLWALYGHLSAQSLKGKVLGQAFKAGDCVGWLGETHENGGWPPHLHFQLSRKRPKGPDLPGAVSASQRAQALIDYPDPRTVLGPLY